MFKQKTGIDVKVVSQGTGQALDTGRRGDADVVFVHAKAQEEKFVADGFGVKRFAVMYNDFILIGPKSDPAGIKGKDIETALKAIKAKAAPFVSRGDKSGTHSAELALWKAAASTWRAPTRARGIARSARAWARRSTPRAMNGYVLADRGTWLSFKNSGELEIVVEGDKRLFNQYGVMLVNPAKHAHVKKDLGQQFIDWLMSPEGQKAIADYKINGEQLFFPNATVPGVGCGRSSAAVIAMTASAALPRCCSTRPDRCAARSPSREGVRGGERRHGAGEIRPIRHTARRDRRRREGGGVRLRQHGRIRRRWRKRARAAPVTMFARNRLCALVGPGLRSTSGRAGHDAARGNEGRHLDAEGRPSGDYAFEVFARAEALKAGSRAALEGKALQLTGGATSAQPPAGRSVYGWQVAEGRADIFLTYCTNAVVALRENPGSADGRAARRARGRRRLRHDRDERRAGRGAAVRAVHPVGRGAGNLRPARFCGAGACDRVCRPSS